MSELRYCPIHDHWVIVAPERKLRPSELVVPQPAAPSPATVPGCPFEYGHEDTGLPEILALPRDQTAGSGPNWQVRVVPDRFPALRVEGEVWREGVGMYDRLAGVGAHEVIVESPNHGRQTADLEVSELAKVLTACRARLVDLRRDQRLRYVMVFKNKGRPAGAALSHPHWQLLATPVIPPLVARELKAGRDHFRVKERCLFCDLIGDEQRLGERVPLETARFVAITPFAAAHPFETWILPKAHGHDFAVTEDDDLRGLAIILRDLLRRLRVLLSDPPYNIVLHNAPSPHPRPALPDYWSTIERDYHWHLELRPRITVPAGFEWAAGLSINPTPPEEAARYLQEADPEGWTGG